MTYNNTPVRRQDRLLSEERAKELLFEGEYGLLSMVDESGHPYGIPISFAYDGAHSLYLHCAPEGRKLNALQHQEEVSFCVVGHTQVLPSKFTTNYESVVIEGTAALVQDHEERWKALRLILEKYAPNDMETGLLYSEKSFHRTAVLRIDIRSWSGKAKKVR